MLGLYQKALLCNEERIEVSQDLGAFGWLYASSYHFKEVEAV